MHPSTMSFLILLLIPISFAAATGEKPGQCYMSQFFMLYVCPNNTDFTKPECESDWNCTGSKKCCDYACRMRCLPPAGEKPGQCKMPPWNIKFVCPPNSNFIVPDCESDWDCTGTKKCCNYFCHVQCLDPADNHPCFTARDRVPAHKTPMIGAYVPECDANGYYKPTQCNPSTGYCWCVTPNGDKIAGTETKPGTSGISCGGKPGQCKKPPGIMKFVCPNNTDFTNPEAECESDYECTGSKKCCDYECRKQCLHPAGEKPGQCYMPPFQMLYVCLNFTKPECESDWDCTGSQKCCEYACRKQCLHIAGEKPGQCQKPPGNIKVVCPHNTDFTKPECGSDYDCRGSKKCCDYGCRKQCLDPADAGNQEEFSRK